MSLSVDSVDVRQSYARLPRFIQPFFTWLTGKPLAGEIPLVKWTPAGRFVGSLAVLGLSVLTSVYLLASAPVLWPLLSVSWMMTAAASRHLYIVTGHYAVHGTFSRKVWVNRLTAEVISTMLFILGYDEYHKEHHVTHHGKALGTVSDPDVRFLLRAGFVPGMSRDALWRHLLKTLVSPRYHALFLKARFISNFVVPGTVRKLFALGLTVATILILALTGGWTNWLVAWVVPLTVGYQASALLQFLSEHRWLLEPGRGALRYGRLTFGRFVGYPAPVTLGLSRVQVARAWASWSIRMMFLALPTRLFVLMGDLPQHDLHHRRPKSDYANAIFIRASDAAASNSGWPEPYVEVWGAVREHIDILFRGWSERGPLTPTEFSALTQNVE